MHAQTGVSDDRVSLPDGPGSLEGLGDNASLNPNMGSMSYAVPIDVPGGFAAVTPSLSLSYSSSAGASVVGVGWMMDTPSIERMTYRKLPLYDDTDDFAADGSTQLIRLSSSNGSSATYRARYEGGFVRYTWRDEDGDGREGYWVAEYPDGSRGYFGARADGTLVPEARVGADAGTFRYMLVEMVDIYGHSMTVSYRRDGVLALPSEMGYVYPEGSATAQYQVRFSYEDRSDPGSDYLEAISDAKAGFEE
ncbi:MAG: SpvB/TcaC N-terminal domain-containing protein, partial [Myxococcota bacterium]